jgi:Fibronectin type III domain
MRGTSWRWRAGALVLAGTGALALTGCGLGDTDVQTTAATAAAPGTSWFLSSGGTAAPTTEPPFIQIGPTIPRPGEFTVPRPVPYGVAPRTTPRSMPCVSTGSPRQVVPGAVAGAGSATVSWQADDRAEVLGYRVQAVSQTLVSGAQPPTVQQAAAQIEGCGTVRVTVTGLTAGTDYVFWLEEQIRDPEYGVVRFVQVGTSDPVRIG